jgi:hypothetical protein
VSVCVCVCVCVRIYRDAPQGFIKKKFVNSLKGNKCSHEQWKYVLCCLMQIPTFETHHIYIIYLKFYNCLCFLAGQAAKTLPEALLTICCTWWQSEHSSFVLVRIVSVNAHIRKMSLIIKTLFTCIRIAKHIFRKKKSGVGYLGTISYQNVS